MTQWGKTMFRNILVLSLLVGGLFAVAEPVNAQFGSADLIISSLSTEPPQPEPDQRIELVAIVTNTGRNNVLQGFNVRFKIDGLLLTDRRVNFGLNAGAEERLTATWRATEGDHVFSVEVDVFKNVEETNEFNNVAEHAFSVRRPGAIRSVTSDMIDSIGLALKESGEEITVDFVPDVFTMINTFQPAFQKASNSFAAAKTKLDNLTNPVPSVLADEAQIQTAVRVAEIYESLSSSFKLASDGLLSFSVQPVLDAFSGIRSSMSIMADLEIEEISYIKLQDTLDLFDLAFEEADLLQQALSGAQVNINQAMSNLVDIMADIGAIWIGVHDDSTSMAQALAPIHRDGSGETIESLGIGEEITVTVAGAMQLELQIFNSTGDSIFEATADGSELSWDGTDSNGSPLGADRYYCRLAVTDSDGNTRTEIVIIIIS